jgi:hypothetical protein
MVRSEIMRHGTKARFLATAAALAILYGCGGHGGGGGPPSDPGPTVAFYDDFSGPFPDPNWDIMTGDPFTSSAEGNGAPSLILQPAGDPILVRSGFDFSTGEATILSFDVASFEVQASTRFSFLVRFSGGGDIDASFDMYPFDDELVLSILGTEVTISFSPSTVFDAIEFSVDAAGMATWSINGNAVLSKSGFPADMYYMDIETVGGDFTVLAVDNVLLIRP